jgi:hypothetical protein
LAAPENFPKEYSFGVKPIHQYQPQEEFDFGNTFGLPECLENWVHLRILEYHLIISFGGIM